MESKIGAGGDYQGTVRGDRGQAITNLFDPRRYPVFGGSVIGRRALVGLTVLR